MGNFIFNPFTRNLDYVGTSTSPGGTLKTLTGSDSVVVSPDSNDNINLLGGSTNSFTEAGIEVLGTTNTETITLTNRQSAQITTTNATPTTILTFSLGSTAAVYSFEGFTSGRATSSGDGASYFFYACFKTNGTTATEVGSESPTYFEDASFIATGNTTLSASGNTAIVQVTGVAATTIDWDAILTYRRVL
jgi:hypothetical protein